MDLWLFFSVWNEAVNSLTRKQSGKRRLFFCLTASSSHADAPPIDTSICMSKCLFSLSHPVLTAVICPVSLCIPFTRPSYPPVAFTLYHHHQPICACLVLCWHLRQHQKRRWGSFERKGGKTQHQQNKCGIENALEFFQYHRQQKKQLFAALGRIEKRLFFSSGLRRTRFCQFREQRRREGQDSEAVHTQD